ncbi:MAG: hypothetical protein ACW98F_10320 [Candidatus Hodarchaeales archaeon]
MLSSQLATKILEDKTTLLQIEYPSDNNSELYASIGVLVSYYAIQPIHDLDNASQNLFRVTSQPGVQVLRQAFSALPRKSKTYSKREISYTGLSLIVRVYYRFPIRSETVFPTILRQVRKEFLKRRTMTYTILKAAGFEVSIVKGRKIFDLHFHGKKVKEGISIFSSQTGSNTIVLDRFFNLERVPSRFIQDFPVPDLPVTHRVGHRIDNSSVPVGFPNLSTGSILVCGSEKNELITLFQKLILSFSNTTKKRGIFVIDTHNEFNGLIHHFQSSTSFNKRINLQLFQLGTNMFINLCDVIIPPSPSGKRQDPKAIDAWKAHLISNIMLSSLSTSEYLTSRFAIPLETQIRNAASGKSSFTLSDVTTTFGEVISEDEEETSEEISPTDGVFADLMAIEHLTGILDQFKAFKEVNYAAFTGHLSNTLFRNDSVTIFQFGAQPPMIKRAVVAFLLQFLSNVAYDGYIVFPHADEILSRKTSYGRVETGIPTVLIDSCNTISRKNVLILGSQSVQALALKVNSFEEIKNQIYLRLVNTEDREIVITQHQLKIRKYTQSSMIERQIMEIREGEGLLFRGDASQSSAFHFKMDTSMIPIDLDQIKVTETKIRGSNTLGLTPDKYKVLMGLLKILRAQPLHRDVLHEKMNITLEENSLLDQLKSYKLYTEHEIEAARQWEITIKGSEYLHLQEVLMKNLPAPREDPNIGLIPREIVDLERFFDRTASVDKSREQNAKVKKLVGQFLNYLFQLTGSIPWERYAQYTDLTEIEGLEGQDFRQLFNLSNEICSAIQLDIKNFNKNLERENQNSPPISPLKLNGPIGNLDQFLPNERLLTLQALSKKLELKTYPDNGILDIHFVLLKQGKNLPDELNLR